MPIDRQRERLLWRSASWRPPELHGDGLRQRREIELASYLDRQVAHRAAAENPLRPLLHAMGRYLRGLRRGAASLFARRTEKRLQ